ncbi:menaquinone biosynthetic enzyme MqnA/MqnD family protein [Deinobacterium chartae]|nr:menaquinone biosynthesis protein [Deinobacterium chartae]
MYTLGLIDYTNVAPLTAHLRDLEGLRYERGVPTAMNAALLEGRVDLSNISSFEFVRNAHRLAALPDFSVSVLGPVYSVNLFHRRPWAELSGQRIALTSQSATSVQLLRVLLEASGVNAVLERAEGDAFTLLDQGYAGVLRIGDDALREWYRVAGPLGERDSMLTLPHQRGDVIVTDLAQRWYDLTGHPFTFAVWAYRRDNPPPAEVVQMMREARRAGIGELGNVARSRAQGMGLPARVIQHYLWNFRYHLEAPDKKGLARFADLACPGHAPLHFGDL